MKYLKPINILYELGVCCLYWISILPITAIILMPTGLMNWFNVPLVILIILCLILIASITIRGMRKYPERIIVSNFLFGLIVGAITSFLYCICVLPGGLVELFSFKVDQLIFSLSHNFIFGVIVGFVAVLWGGIVPWLIVLKKRWNRFFTE